MWGKGGLELGLGMQANDYSCKILQLEMSSCLWHCYIYLIYFDWYGGQTCVHVNSLYATQKYIFEHSNCALLWWLLYSLEWYQAHFNLTKCIFCRICTSWMLIYVEYMHPIFTLHPRKLHTPYRISYKFYSSPWILETMHDIQFLPH